MNNMNWLAIVAALVAFGVILYFVIQYLSSRSVAIGQARTVSIVGPIADARNPSTFKGQVDVSKDEPQGLTFSYSGWILIEDWMYRQGALKCIFNKGTADFSAKCPGLFLDPNSNAMILKVDTFGDPESLDVPNLPARKWIHFVIVVDQTSLNLYIDGVLRKHHGLKNLPKQNDGAVFVAGQGGWGGQIGSLTYHRYAVEQSEVSALMAVAPYEDSTKSKIPLPPYFDNTWYIGRF
jgi:hypothetical protein